MQRRHRAWIIAPIAVGLLASIPIPYLASPDWHVWVVDEAGSRIEGVTIRRVYQNYSTESEGHEDDLTTDKQGHAAFPAVWANATVARRCAGILLSARAGVHASFGRHAYVIAFGNGREGQALAEGSVLDWKGEPALLKSWITATAIRDLR